MCIIIWFLQLLINIQFSRDSLKRQKRLILKIMFGTAITRVGKKRQHNMLVQRHLKEKHYRGKQLKIIV